METQDFRRWLIPSARVHTNVEIRAFLTAEAYYEALRSLIDKTSKGDLIFLSGWEMDIHQPFGANLPSVDSVHKVLAAAAGRGAKMRALLDEDQHVAVAKLISESTHGILGSELTDADKFRDAKNREAVKAINDLGGQAMLDDQHLKAGAFHQKLAFVKVAEEAYGFCGGFDIARNWTWRDVQLQFKGAAALEILATLNERWDSKKGQKTIRPVTPPITGAPTANNYLQVARTYGRPDRWTEKTGRLYAKDGEFGVYDTIANAVGQARRFIYVEDQYLYISKMNKGDIAALLNERLKKVPGLQFIAAIARTEQIENEIKQGWYRRKRFIEQITSGVSDSKNRVHILQYKSTLTSGYDKGFIHTKMWIFDDEFAVVGSANLNRRGYSYDGECVVGVTGKDLFARKLRVRKWVEHLSLTGRVTAAEVSEWPNGLARLLGTKSPFERYNPDGGVDRFGDEGSPPSKTPTDADNMIWNLFLDPDGS